MSVLIMVVYITEENGKIDCLRGTLASLDRTVDFSRHRMVIVNNNSTIEAYRLVQEFEQSHKSVQFISNLQNVGTARAINQGLRLRHPNEFAIKLDDDWATSHVGWVDEMESEIDRDPIIGILGLKRDDVYGEMISEGNLLWCHDIFGTCTMYNPKMLDKVGGLVQFSKYGYDDCVLSVRSEAAGFRNAFMANIRIANLDLKETPYTDWKRREAGLYIQEASALMGHIKNGTISYYYDMEDEI